jgi:hypothetical protein
MAPVLACSPAVLGSGPATAPAAGATDGFAVSDSVHPTYHQQPDQNQRHESATCPREWRMEEDPDLRALRELRRRDIVTRSKTRRRVLRGLQRWRCQRALLLLHHRRRALRRGASPRRFAASPPSRASGDGDGDARTRERGEEEGERKRRIQNRMIRSISNALAGETE